MVAVAVKVTDVPAQNVPLGLSLNVTVGVTFGFTVMVMLLLVTLAGTAQVALEARTTVTTSLLFNVVVVNVFEAPFCLLTPFTRKSYAGDAPPLVAAAVNVTLVPAQMVEPH